MDAVLFNFKSMSNHLVTLIWTTNFINMSYGNLPLLSIAKIVVFTESVIINPFLHSKQSGTEIYVPNNYHKQYVVRACKKIYIHAYIIYEHFNKVTKICQ